VLAPDRYGTYQYTSGTSIAAPHVAGALALLLGADPGLTVTAQQAALTSTARDLGTAGPDDRYGFGRLDVAAARQWLVAQPDVAVDVTPASAVITAGESTTYTVQVTPLNGFDGNVTLALTGLDGSQTSWSFTPSVLTGGGTSQLGIVTSSSTPAGNYALTVTASNGSVARSAAMALAVTAPPDFALSASPATLTVKRGSTATYVITATALGGFAEQVPLSLSGLPAKTTSSWTGNPVVVPGTTSLRIATTSATKRGTSVLVVSGTSGALAHQISIVLNIS
jgi:hypothetical protein